MRPIAHVEDDSSITFPFGDLLVGSLPMGVAYLDSEGVIVAANTTAERILGLSLEQMQGRKTIDPRWQAIREDGSPFPGEAHPAMVALQTGRPVRNVRMGVFNPKSESQTWIFVSAFPLIDNTHGTVKGVYAIFDDITYKKNKALAGEAMYRRLHESLLDAFVLVDMSGHLRDWNGAYAELLGYSEEELQGRSYIDLTPSQWHAPEAQIIAEQVIPCGQSAVYQKEYIRKDGTVIPVELRTFLLRNSTGEPEAMWAILRDITARKQVEAELIAAKEAAERANQAKTRFLAAASHDLRQPIQSIVLYNAALIRSGLNETQQRISRNLTTAVNSLGGLLNDFLDISEIDSGLVKPDHFAIEPQELLGTLEAEFYSLAREKGLRLNVFCPRRGMTLLSDDNLLLALLRNLINNAVKYTNRGGVLVGARQRGDRALIQVWDTGIGIAPEQLDMIFEEYFQVGNPERDRSKGVGLGLAIVRRLSELLGADIRCRSCVDKGSVFEISVPLLNGSGRPAEPDDIYATALGGTLEGGRDHGLDRALERLSGKRIVVVEDDAMAAEAIKLTLEMHRVKVSLFHSAEAALQSAEVKGADYYLSDYRLSGMDGVQFLDAIQKNSPTRIKAVLLTGDTSPERIAAARSSGWTLFFKPVDLRSVLSAMEW